MSQQWTKPQLIELVRQTARKYGIDEKIALAQINQESGFRVNVGSSAGAYGIAQFMPATARRFGVNVFDPVSSMEGWGKYMTFLLKRFNGNYSLALAGYNAGEGAVDKYKGIPPFNETQNYVKTILSNAGQNISDFVGGVTDTVSSFASGFWQGFFGRTPTQTQTFTPKTVTKDERRTVILFVASLVIVIAVVSFIRN